MLRQELVSKLEIVSRALADNSLVPIFQCLCFSGKTVTAYNDTLAISSPCPTPGAFALHGKTLLGLLSNSQSDEVEFKLEINEVTIKAERSTFKLPYLLAEDFVFEEPKIKPLTTINLDESSLNGFAACLQTTSKDQAQPALMGVCLNPPYLYSCDGDALSRYKLDMEATGGPYLITNDFCETLAKLGGPDTDTRTGLLELDDQWAKAKVEGFTIYGRLIEQDNPLDHAALIKQTLKSEPIYKPMPEGLNEALARARVIADQETTKTSLSVASGILKLLTEVKHIGVVRDSVPFKGHPDVEANASAELMQRCIGLCNEMAVLENCTVYRSGKVLLQIISNME